MKKILIIVTTFLLTSTSVFASQEAMNYANPMPNLVRYVMKNADVLKLTDAQKASIKEWASVNKPRVRKLVRELNLQENKLLKEALSTDENVIAKAESTLEVRREIIEIKTLCRAHLKDILTPEQYAQLVAIYKEEQYKESQLIL